jgi:diguanylate cyclase
VTELPTEQERTLAFAEIALGQIRSLKQTAVPRNYEIWYIYATGLNANLNKAINETLARTGKLSEAELELIYETYLSQGRLSDQIDKVGSRVIGELDQVMALVSNSLGHTVEFSDTLNESSKNLASSAGDRQSILSIVEKLITSTKTMYDTNKEMESRLTSSRKEIAALQQNLEEVRAESMTDPLSGLSNRKFFDRSMAKMIAEMREKSDTMTLLILDIDHFKSFNDTYGHLTGDQVLRLVAQTIKQCIKGRDVAARYGGEEFAVLLPMTRLRQGLTVADQIRRAVMSKELKKKSTGEVLGRVTISIGVATLTEEDSAHSLFDRADACLYAAKRAGRNRVVGELDSEYRPTTAHVA